jgi:hydroxyacylglutathione hydrolase
MIFRQITHDDLGCASYLVGDEDAGVAAVIDPRFDIDEYLDLARYMNVRIEHVLETHNHADHVSGHGRLAAATGATIHIHQAAEAAYEHEPFDDGDELHLGALTIRVLHTPGHRPEHSAFALVDTQRGEEPWALLTGDSLFVGDIARPDLAVEETEGAQGIFRSLHEKLLPIGDEVEVWPAHLGGSMCGGPGMDMKISSTIGFERRHNAALGIDDEEEFVRRALDGLGPQPPNFETIVELNKGPLIREAPEPVPLAPAQVQEALESGSLVMDVRTDKQFDDAHIPGTVCNPIARAGFGSKLAWLVGRDQEIVVVGRDDADGIDAARLATAVGVGTLRGYLRGGMTTWDQEHRPVERLERITIEELRDRIESDPDLQVVDVRERDEWERVHLPKSTLATWHDIRGLPDGLDAQRPIAVACASGQRAATAASLVRRAGAERVIHVVGGGIGTLGDLGLELVTGS